MQKIVFACDPGSGTRSAFGICIYSPDKDEILSTLEIRPNLQKPTWKRIADVAHQVKDVILTASAKYGPLEIRSERFIMRGLGGETLNRLIGAIIAAVPVNSTFVEVHNIILKKDLTGNYQADKIQIGEGLIKRFPKQKALIENLIKNEQLDALDAIAIAVCRITVEEK